MILSFIDDSEETTHDPIKHIVSNDWRIGISLTKNKDFNIDTVYTKQLDIKFRKEILELSKILFINLPIHESEYSLITLGFKSSIQERVILLIRGTISELFSKKKNKD